MAFFKECNKSSGWNRILVKKCTTWEGNNHFWPNIDTTFECINVWFLGIQYREAHWPRWATLKMAVWSQLVIIWECIDIIILTSQPNQPEHKMMVNLCRLRLPPLIQYCHCWSDHKAADVWLCWTRAVEPPLPKRSKIAHIQIVSETMILFLTISIDVYIGLEYILSFWNQKICHCDLLRPSSKKDFFFMLKLTRKKIG